MKTNKAYYVLPSLISWVLSSIFVMVIVHELVHYSLCQKTEFIGFVFNKQAFAVTHGISGGYSQEPLAYFLGTLIAVLWFVLGMSLEVKRFRR